jgi:DNA modification methylase
LKGDIKIIKIKIKIKINTIYNEDCLLTMKNMPDNFIDLVITSPPYDDLRNYNGYSFDFKNIANELFRIVKEGGIIVWVVSDSCIDRSESGNSFRQALYFKKIGFKLHDTMIWQKSTFTAVGALKTRYAPVFEYMFVLVKGKIKTFNPIKDRPNKSFGSKFHGTNRQKDGSTKSISGVGKIFSEFGQRFNIWEIANIGNKNEKHPATFPEQLVKDHIISWSNKNDLVYDPFLGSGTTCKVAKELNRNYIGSEISKEYFDIAYNRINNNYLF